MEQIILANLIHNDNFNRATIPFLKESYFSDPSDVLLFNTINEYVTKYNKLPTKESLNVDIFNVNNVSDNVKEETIENLEKLQIDPETSIEWLIEHTENFCKDKSLYNAMMQAIDIVQDEDTDTKNNISKTGIPDLLSEALSVSFDQHIGHDFIEQSSERFETLHKKEKRFRFDLELLNKITGGGLTKKTLNLILAGTGGFKSGAMCHMAAAYIREGYNVLYISMEMSEEKVAERIDANLMDTNINDFKRMDTMTFDKKIKRVKKKVAGRLIIKEYPTSSAHAGHFRFLISELKQKKNFKADIIIIDYINICSSSRTKSNDNSYHYIKAIAEELRGLAVEQDVPMITASQLNRSGYENSDVDLTNISECLSPKTKVIKSNGDHVHLSTVKVGDKILGSNGFVSVLKTHDNKFKKMFKIKTKSGKTVIVSKEHKFPTDNGRSSLSNGLKIGSKINSL